MSNIINSILLSPKMQLYLLDNDVYDQTCKLSHPKSPSPYIKYYQTKILGVSGSVNEVNLLVAYSQ